MIVGFIHTYTVNDWAKILEEQLDRMERSGLTSHMDKIFVGVNGDIGDFDLPEKAEILYQIDKPDLYEALTLSMLRLFCLSNEDVKLFYIHSKGVSRNSPKCFRDWRVFMEYYVIERWKECVWELTQADIVGVNWHHGEGYMGACSKKADGILVTPHFSGNFWWSHSEYIKKLPALYPLKSRYECEFWIGKGQPLICELWNSNIHHHRTSYPEDKYYGKKLVKYTSIC